MADGEVSVSDVEMLGEVTVTLEVIKGHNEFSFMSYFLAINPNSKLIYNF